MIDLKLLRQAAVLARHRNFARAAEALHVSQPALSRSIARLEADLGVRLFNRTTQGVEPTAFGELLLARGGALLEDARELDRSIQLMRGVEIGELRVGAGIYPAALSVGRAVGRLMTQHPYLRVDVELADLRAIVEGVTARRLDLAVIELSLVEGEPRIATEALPKHPAYFYCRSGHPLAGQRRMTIDDIVRFPFAGTRLSRRVAADFLRAAKSGTVDPVSGDYLPPLKVDSVRVAKEIVLGSDALGVSPLSPIAPEIEAGSIVVLPVQLPWMCTAYGFIYRRDRELSPAAQAFMRALRAVEAEVVEQEERLTRNALRYKAQPVRARPTAKRRRQQPAASKR